MLLANGAAAVTQMQPHLPPHLLHIVRNKSV
jgi:hypothetical protein